MSTSRYDLLLAAMEHSDAKDVSGLALADRQPPPWETSMQATCDCLSWRGALGTMERRQAEDDLGETLYAGVPAQARPALVAAHLLIDKGIITEDELQAKMADVRARFEKV